MADNTLMGKYLKVRKGGIYEGRVIKETSDYLVIDCGGGDFPSEPWVFDKSSIEILEILSIQ